MRALIFIAIIVFSRLIFAAGNCEGPEQAVAAILNKLDGAPASAPAVQSTKALDDSIQKAEITARNYPNKAAEAIAQKESLLKTKYLGENTDASALSMDDLLKAQSELKAKVGKPGEFLPPYLKPEKDVLKTVEAEIQVRRQAALEKASAEFKSDKLAAEKVAREKMTDAAAHPLTADQSEKVSRGISLLERDPKSLTPEQVKELDQLRRELLAKRTWKNGTYDGPTAEDSQKIEAFAKAWDKAAKDLEAAADRSVRTLAQQQGREIKPANTQQNVTDSFGRPLPERSINSRSTLSPGDRDRIQAQLNSIGDTPRPQLVELAEFSPAITSRADFTSAAEALKSAGVSAEQIHAVNRLSTLETININQNALSELSQAKDFLRKIDAAGLSTSNNQALQRLIETTRHHVRYSIPSHLRINNFEGR